MTGSSKPRKVRVAARSAPMHRASAALGAALSRELRGQYHVRSVRVRVGDSVKVMRGSYKGLEGKVLRVFVKEGRLAIEGLNKQNSKGSNVPVRVHASKVMVMKLNLDDEIRRDALEAKSTSKSASGSSLGGS